MKYNYLVIEGAIGAGKTSLATMISEQYNAKLILEQFEENPFLPKFYEEPAKFAFPLEMSFMASRFQQLKDELSNRDLFKSFTVADYVLNKSLIFARETLEMDEFKLFSRFFGFINSGLPKPDLIVYLYLDTDKLKSNILKRGRSYELEISEDYLKGIQNGYMQYFRQNTDLRILVIDTNTIDFVNNPKDYENILKLLEEDYDKGIKRIIMK